MIKHSIYQQFSIVLNRLGIKILYNYELPLMEEFGKVINYRDATHMMQMPT